MGTKNAGLLTARGLAAMAAGEWAADPAARGAGVLQVRKLAGGQLAFYYRYTTSAGDRDRMPLGSGLSLAEARSQAGELSRRYQAGDRDLRAVLEAERREADRQNAVAEAAKTAKKDSTLKALMAAYVAAMRAAGKGSADDVQQAVQRHIILPWPVLAAMPADNITLDDLIPVVSRLVQAGKLREAGKIRSYLRAGYQAAIGARQNPAAPDELRDLGISTNPARDLATIDGANKARDRVLSLAELRFYWYRLTRTDGAQGALLRFHLLTGGQRVAQLVRLQVEGLDEDARTITIMDGKGRRKRARVHVVPLIAPALAEIAIMRGRKLGPNLFTLSEGVEPASYDQLHGLVREVSDAMQAANELEGGHLTPGDIRRTVETRLAAAGQNDETRGHLQSHGLGGVQNRHYNHHRYNDEKLAALEILFKLINGKKASVTPIRSRRKG